MLTQHAEQQPARNIAGILAFWWFCRGVRKRYSSLNECEAVEAEREPLLRSCLPRILAMKVRLVRHHPGNPARRVLSAVGDAAGVDILRGPVSRACFTVVSAVCDTRARAFTTVSPLATWLSAAGLEG
jgi:hypothetical protein